MIKKLIKPFFYSFVFFFSIFLLTAVYVNEKLHDEVEGYLATLDKVNELNDTYILCVGLVSQNPSEENTTMCESLKSELKLNFDSLKNNYPYMNFYNSLVKN